MLGLNKLWRVGTDSDRSDQLCFNKIKGGITASGISFYKVGEVQVMLIVSHRTREERKVVIDTVEGKEDVDENANRYG